MDAVLVKTLANRGSLLHVSLRSVTLEVVVDADVKTGNELGVAELPDVEVVNTLNTRKVLDVVANIVHFNAVGNSLEENAGCGLAERNGRAKDDDCNDERNGRIEVVAASELALPDDDGCDNDTNVSKSVSHDVQEDSLHVEITVRVTATTTSAFSRLAMLVLGVVDGLAWDRAVASVRCGNQRVSLALLHLAIVLIARVLGVRLDRFQTSLGDDGVSEASGTGKVFDVNLTF